MTRKLIFILIVAFTVSGCATFSPKETQIAVKQLVDQVQTAVDIIEQQTSGSEFPPLKMAELTLSSKAKKEANGQVALFLSAKGGKAQTDSNSITLVLIPNPIRAKGLVKGPGQNIANAVVAAVSGLKDIQGLKLKSLTVVAELEIVTDAAGGIKVELSGVSIEGQASKTVTTGHSLKIVFESPEEASENTKNLRAFSFLG